MGDARRKYENIYRNDPSIGSGWVGLGEFLLPDDVDGSTMDAILVPFNYRGPSG